MLACTASQNNMWRWEWGAWFVMLGNIESGWRGWQVGLASIYSTIYIVIVIRGYKPSEILNITISWYGTSVVFSWFKRLITVIWCHFLNLSDCSTCSNSCLHPLPIHITDSYPTKISGSIWQYQYEVFGQKNCDIWFCCSVLAFMKWFWGDFSKY